MNMKSLIFHIALASGLLTGAAFGASKATITMQSFGKTKEGVDTALYTLTNANGVKTDITNYGGIVVRLFVPDREGNMDDVVLGYNTVAE